MKKQTRNIQPQPISPELHAAIMAVRYARRALNAILDNIDYAGWSTLSGPKLGEVEQGIYQAAEAAQLPAQAAAYAAAWENYLKARGITL